MSGPLAAVSHALTDFEISHGVVPLNDDSGPRVAED